MAAPTIAEHRQAMLAAHPGLSEQILIVVTLPACASDTGTPVAVIPVAPELRHIDGADGLFKDGALEAIRARGLLHHGEDLLPDAEDPSPSHWDLLPHVEDADAFVLAPRTGDFLELA